MRLSSNNIFTKIANFIKVPHSDILNKGLYFEPVRAILSGHQIAYKLTSGNETVIFYKKSNLNVFGKIEDTHSDKSTRDMKHFFLPLSNKKDFIVYQKNYVLQYSYNIAFRFVGIDYELYEVVYKGTWERGISIRKFTNGDIILDLDFSAYSSVGIPLYNNYIPIAFVTDEYLKVLIYNLIDKQILEVAEYSLDFLEKEIFKYLNSITKYSSGHKASTYRIYEKETINKLLARYKTAYRIKRPNTSREANKEGAYEICNDFVICKSFLHVINEVLLGPKYKTMKPIFVLTFSATEDMIECELSIPKDVPIRALGLDKTPKKHIIDTKRIRVELPKHNNKIPGILYHDKNYAIVPSFFDTNKYFIVASDGSIKYVINIKNYDHFHIYIDDEFIFFIYKDEEEDGNIKRLFYIILVYNTVKNYWVEYAESYGDICGFCYIKKCKNLILFKGSPLSHMEFDLKTFTIIDLAEVDEDKEINSGDFVQDYGYHIDYYPSKHEIKDYLMSKYKDKCPKTDVNDIRIDFTVDQQRGIIYMICSTEILSYSNCTIKFIGLEYDLCKESKFRDLKIGHPIIMTNDMLKNNIPIFISNKSLKHKSMPKYISGYISKYFYDFMRNKSFSSDVVFSSISSDHGILIRDKHFNRVSIALIEFKTLGGVMHMFWDNDLVVLEKKDIKRVAGVFIIDDLKIVKLMYFTKTI